MKRCSHEVKRLDGVRSRSEGKLGKTRRRGSGRVFQRSEAKWRVFQAQAAPRNCNLTDNVTLSAKAVLTLVSYSN